MENSFVDMKLSAASQELRLAQGHLGAVIEAGKTDTSSVATLDRALANIREARHCIDEISRQIEADVDAAPVMRDCPACGRSIRAKATLCGYCWTKQG